MESDEKSVLRGLMECVYSKKFNADAKNDNTTLEGVVFWVAAWRSGKQAQRLSLRLLRYWSMTTATTMIKPLIMSWI